MTVRVVGAVSIGCHPSAGLSPVDAGSAVGFFSGLASRSGTNWTRTIHVQVSNIAANPMNSIPCFVAYSSMRKLMPPIKTSAMFLAIRPLSASELMVIEVPAAVTAQKASLAGALAVTDVSAATADVWSLLAENRAQDNQQNGNWCDDGCVDVEHGSVSRFNVARYPENVLEQRIIVVDVFGGVE